MNRTRGMDTALGSLHQDLSYNKENEAYSVRSIPSGVTRTFLLSGRESFINSVISSRRAGRKTKLRFLKSFPGLSVFLYFFCLYSYNW